MNRKYYKIKLTNKQKKRLKKIYKSEKGRISARAHIVLLYSEDYTVRDISNICLCEEKTIRSTLEKYEKYKFEGIYDKKHTGRSSILSKEDEEFLFSCLEKSPFDYGYFATVWTVELMIELLKSKRN